VGKRIIITNGDWTTSHEIGDSAIVIGRDPNCDLFFVNQKLSRRHARIEPGPDGVKLVDLGSRNGMWVNEEKVGERLLRAGDAIWLGGLEIAFEEDNSPSDAERERPEGEEATIILSAHQADEIIATGTGEPAQGEVGGRHADATVVLADGEPTADQTVMLAPDSPGSPDVNDSSQTVVLTKEPAELEESSATVILANGPTELAESEESSGTVVLGKESTESEDGSATIVLAKRSAEPEESSATVVLSAGGKTDAGEGEVDETRYFAGEAATLSPVADAPLLVPDPEPLASVARGRLAPFAQLRKSRLAAEAFMSRAAERFALLSWEAKFILVLSGVGLIVTFILATIALRTNSALVGVLAGLPLIVGWAYTGVVLARHLTVRPVAELARDVKAFGRGEKPPLLHRKDYPELDKLSEGIGRLVGLAQSSAVSTDSGVSDSSDSDEGDSELEQTLRK